MKTADLYALAAPLLDRIGWPEGLRMEFLPVRAEPFFPDSWEVEHLGLSITTESAAAVIRCFVEDWLLKNDQFIALFPPDPNDRKTGHFLELDNHAPPDTRPCFNGPTLLHALIAAATTLCDQQDQLGKAHLESRSEMARICREGKLP